VLLAALASTYVVRRPAGAPVSAFDSTLPTWRSQWLPADPKAWATAGIDEPPPVGSRPSLRWPVLPAAVFASLVAWVLLPAAVVWLMNGDPGQFGTVAAAVGILGAHLVALATCLASVRQRLDPTAPQGVPANGEVASVDPARVHFTVDTLELRLPVRTRTRGRLFAFGLHVVVMLVCAVPMMLLSAAAVASSSSAAWLVIVALLVMAIALALWLAAAVGTAAAVVFGASELWDRAVQPRWIRLGARTLLTSEGEDFALDAPGLTTRLAWDGNGARLLLRSDLQEVTVRGPYRELNWLRAHLLHRPATDHDPGQATRAAIAGLIAASGARVPSG
jgi:hypothetical protein